MIKEKQKAATPAATGITAEQQISPTSEYQANRSQSTSNRQERITQRLRDIPKIYRRIYQQAVKGKSRKAAIHAFCLECTYWQKEEVRKCTSLACPLYALRPYRGASNQSDNRLGSAPELHNSTGGGL